VRVVGIDPGLGCAGYGVVEGGERIALVEAGVISTRERDATPDRLRRLHDDVAALLREVRPEAVAVEQLYSHYAHPRTAILMGHARGVILLAAAECGVPVTSYAATMIKKSLTGNGRASKEQVQRMVQATLGLSEPPEPHDVSDALAAALCHLNAAAKPPAVAETRT